MSLIGLVALTVLIVALVRLNRVKQEPPKKSKPLTKVEQINNVAIGGIEIPEGEQTLSVFVYDGTPVKGAVGSVKLVVAPGTISITSIYTGTTWVGNGAVYAGGQPVGFMSDKHPSSDVKKLAQKYGHAVVCGRIRAPFRFNEWPTITLYLPNKNWFDEALNRK